MRILGIETSCDETAAAVVENGKKILSQNVVSSLKEHSAFGGIIPEIASRRQLEYLTPIVEKTLAQARCSFKTIDRIAVTTHPGLSGSLLVGVSFAQALAKALDKPFIGVDHIRAHVYANCLYIKKRPKDYPQLPAIGLVVSGGHTSLFAIKKWPHFKLLGQTRDDAAGEAFDKVARILKAGYPGGPAIERMAKKSKKQNLHFKCAPLKGSCDFSFSGIKTAVLYHVRDLPDIHTSDKNRIAAAFQSSVVENIIQKTIQAALDHKYKTILVGGGVAANQYLRTQLSQAANEHKINVFVPPLSLCLDNAAMIAGLAFYK